MAQPRGKLNHARVNGFEFGNCDKAVAVCSDIWKPKHPENRSLRGIDAKLSASQRSQSNR
jgi:hypothetical protein